MSKSSKLRKAPGPGNSPSTSLARRCALPLLLAVITFLVYVPSLRSDFVYDARTELLKEGFITSIANLPDVLTLKVLGMPLMLGSRPGHLLYLMLTAAVWKTDPWGYHLGSNLLHAANVALLFVLLRRLSAAEFTGRESSAGSREEAWKIQVALVAVTLLFALHPLATEPVANVSYSSDLLVTFFTLLALLAATAFRPDDSRTAFWTGSLGVFCALASVTCKESGLATALLLIVYWLLFRRGETRKPWFLFLSVASILTALFLFVRFAFAPAPSAADTLHYLGGSFAQALWNQPRLWVFMLGQMLWPVHLSADYTLENAGGVALPFALAILLALILFQAWLTIRSRTGALGVAMFWLGLATVSNFVPLYRILADRFYYLPMAGVAMQLLAVLLLVRSRPEFWMMLAIGFVALVPLTLLTLLREQVFASDDALWTDTLQVSPYSYLAHYNLGNGFLRQGKLDEAWTEYQKALAINPDYASPYNTLGIILAEKHQLDAAKPQFQRAIGLNPDFADAHGNLGILFSQQGQVDQAIIEFQRALALDPGNSGIRNNLGVALLQKGEVNDAIVQFQEVIRENPDNDQVRNNLKRAEAMRK